MIYKQDSIANAPEQYIIHGCNAQSVMGSGVAKTLRDKWPAIFAPYITHLKQFARRADALGSLCYAQIEPNRFVVNAITQVNYGRAPGVKYASPAAISNVLFTLAESLTPFEGVAPSIASSKIGCGLGGLNWVDIVKIYQTVEIITGVEFVIYDNQPISTAVGPDVSTLF